MKPGDTPIPIDPGVSIGHVHLKVANLERALAFYCGVLEFQLTQRMADRPRGQWPRSPDGQLAMFTRRLGLDSLLALTNK